MDMQGGQRERNDIANENRSSAPKAKIMRNLDMTQFVTVT